MRPESTPSTKATRRSGERPVVAGEARDDNFYRFVGISTSMLSLALSDDATLESLMERALVLARDVARSEVEIIGVRIGDAWNFRTSGLDVESTPYFASTGADIVGDEIACVEGVQPIPPDMALAILGPDLANHPRVETWHCVPLMNGEHRLGVLILGMSHRRTFSDGDQHLLKAFGARAVTALMFHMQRAALERAVRARDQVLSLVAHDLKNPLHVIAIAANALLQRFSDSPARRPVDRIIRSAQRADQIIRDLLEIDAMEMGRLSLEPHPIEPADVILAALDSQQGLAAEASVIIAADLSPELPGIDADEERLHRVLENLIGNAIKFTDAGGQITVGASYDNEEILVWVKDSGAGIAPDDLPHIFDRFYQASKAERRGTGLGLTICKGIVEAHKGRIWVESTPGVGTTAFFTLPATPARATPSPSTKRANILLVDDRPENLMALKAILERPEYRLVTATSGEEALSIALREQFAVALIDVAMPRMNGLDVAVNLKALERSRDIPIIFITAFGNDPEEIHRAYTAGGADYLVKPLDPEIVRKKVAVFVELSRRRGNGNANARF